MTNIHCFYGHVNSKRTVVKWFYSKVLQWWLPNKQTTVSIITIIRGQRKIFRLQFRHQQHFSNNVTEGNWHCFGRLPCFVSKANSKKVKHQPVLLDDVLSVIRRHDSCMMVLHHISDLHFENSWENVPASWRTGCQEALFNALTLTWWKSNQFFSVGDNYKTLLYIYPVNCVAFLYPWAGRVVRQHLTF